MTESTISDLADAGITHVRIPIGHWITCDIADDEPFVCGEWSYLKRVASGAKYDVLVWLDLHTAPGSQNGFDNSGHTGDALWDKSMANVNRTLRVVDEIASKVAEDDAFSSVMTGFGLLNEPDAGIDYWRMLNCAMTMRTRRSGASWARTSPFTWATCSCKPVHKSTRDMGPPIIQPVSRRRVDGVEAMIQRMRRRAARGDTPREASSRGPHSSRALTFFSTRAVEL